jgi:hypothetical protein
MIKESILTGRQIFLVSLGECMQIFGKLCLLEVDIPLNDITYVVSDVA